MFNLRRSRLFLLVATIIAISVYYLVLPLRPSFVSKGIRLVAPQHGDSKPNKPQDVSVQRPPPAQKESEELFPPKITTRPHGVDLIATDDNVATTTSSLTTSSQHAEETTKDQKTGIAAGPERLENTDEAILAEDDDLKDDQRSHGRQRKQRYPVPKEAIINLPTGKANLRPSIQFEFSSETISDRNERLAKQTIIRKSFQHAWQGYKTYAMGHDELKPVSADSANPPQFMGWGATLVDTLDTLWIMGMHEDFGAAVEAVSKIDFTSSSSSKIPMFETVIRYLGGLLAAYDLSAPKYPVLLTKAVELADVLLGAFDTPNRMPVPMYAWNDFDTTKPHRSHRNTVLAELGTMSLEFTRLAQLTQNHTYYDAIARVTYALERFQMETALPGLWPLRVDSSGCETMKTVTSVSDQEAKLDKSVTKSSAEKSEDLLEGDEPAIYQSSRTKGKSEKENLSEESVEKNARSTIKRDTSALPREKDCKAQGLAHEPGAKMVFGIGGQADSVYEYLPKMHSLLGGLVAQYKTMYEKAIKTIRTELLFQPMIKNSNRDILFAAKHEFSHDLKSQGLKKKVIWEGTHLSCFAGGMLGLASKLFDVPADLQLAKRLTDGCIWAYESMPSGIMPEEFVMVPCDSKQACFWSDKKWHEALDPNYQERLDTAEAWNQNQRKIYGSPPSSSHDSFEQGALKTAPTKPEATLYKGGIMHDSGYQHNRRDGQESSEKPTKASLHVYEDTEDVSGTLEFKPKVALSHEKFVQARIQEERLLPGYTGILDTTYRLRPEAIESVFIMWRLTGEKYWREKGWKMFESIQAATQTKYGNAAIYDVTSVLGEQKDNMESFWLAETLKYFYLLFSEPGVISLDEYVLNTEAHPFRLPLI